MVVYVFQKKMGEKKMEVAAGRRSSQTKAAAERTTRSWWSVVASAREIRVFIQIWRDDRVFVTQKQASTDFPKCRSGLVCDRPSFQHIFFYLYIHSSCKDLHNQTVAVYIQLLFSTGKSPAADTMVNALVMSKFPQSEVYTSGFYGRQSYLSSL
jgi:hypothetical protein